MHITSSVKVVILFACSFVQKPRKGVKFLQERGLVGSEAIDVAQFFYDDDRLDRVSYDLASVINVLLMYVCILSLLGCYW